jgi:hypothetical protein
MHVVYVIASSRVARLRLRKLVRAAAGGPPAPVIRLGVTAFACPSETWRRLRGALHGVRKAARQDGWTPAVTATGRNRPSSDPDGETPCSPRS